jgi:hypothetical protein
MSHLNSSTRSSKPRASIVAAPTGAPKVRSVLTKDEVAEILRVTPSCVTELTRPRCSRPLKFIKIGKFVRFRLSDILDYVGGAAPEAGA